MKVTCKNVFLFLAMAIVGGITTGRPQSSGGVERGLDPLEGLESGVRHNVWIVLDSSESMTRDFSAVNFGSNAVKLDAAKGALERLIQDEAVDISGRPLVNWSYTSSDQCDGLNQNTFVTPSVCGGPDSRNGILTALGVPARGGSTPTGKSLDQISRRIVAGHHVLDLQEGQKNLIILVTGGDDTCESESRLLDGATSARLRTRDRSPTPIQDVQDGQGNLIPERVRAYNTGLWGKLAYERLNPGAFDRRTGEKGSIFVIGVGVSPLAKARMNHLSWEASGASHGNPNARSALFAESPEELMERLRNLLAMITIPRSEVSLGGPVVGSVKELIPLANPSVTPSQIMADVTGGDVRSLRSRYRNNVLFTTSVETPGFKGHLKAFNVYKVLDYGLPTQRRQADFSQIWDAGERLRARHPDDRTILFNLRNDRPGSSLHELRLYGEFSRGELADFFGVDRGYLQEIDGTGAQTKEDAAEIVVKVIRGHRLAVDPMTDTIYRQDGILNFFTTDNLGNPTWKLLDATNAGPAVVGSPLRAADFDPPRWHGAEYGGRGASTGFYWNHLNRQTVIYLGTNGGMMHAFRADNGAELFAYIPDDILGLDANLGDEIPGSRSTLKDLVALVVAEANGASNHLFFIAASATSKDAFLNSSAGGDDQWHTILAFGRGKGGKFLTALDVSDIGDWDRDPSNTGRLTDPTRYPKLLFNHGNRSGDPDPIYGDLGETWSTPVMGNVRSAMDGDQWVLFAGSGYGRKATMEGRFLYVLRLEDGSPLPGLLNGQIGPIESHPFAPIEHNGLVAPPALYNPPGWDHVTRLYIGDLQGAVHKLDCSDPDPARWTFRTFYELGRDQPITAPVALFTNRSSPKVFVFVGSGGDHRVHSTNTRFKLAGLVDEDLDGANMNTPGIPIRGPLGDEFLVELPQDSRVFVAPTLAPTADGGGAVFFASSRRVFDSEECVSHNHSTLFVMEASTGLVLFDLDPELEGDQNRIDLGDGKVVGLYHRDEHLYVGKSAGEGQVSETEVRGAAEFPDAQASTGPIQLLISGFCFSPF